MATQITTDFVTDNEREVASILYELPTLFLSRKRAEATHPREPTSPVLQNNLQNKKKEGPTSPVTPLYPPNSSSKEQLVVPSAKPVKKTKSKKERLMEKKEELTLLFKEKEDLTREFLELQEKCRNLKAMNFYLKDIKYKLKPVSSKMSTNKSSLNFKIKLALLPKTPLNLTAIEKPKGEFNLNAVVAQLTCDQFYREEKAAKAAQARKRRLEIMQGTRTSSACKRPRVQ